MELTVIEMMNKIGSKVKALDAAKTTEEREMAIADAELISMLSKQFFNGADLVVRTENLLAKNKSLNESRLNAIIGD